jgi:very-short-patch-repair endonuclease
MKKILKEINCAFCKKLFVPKTATQGFCGRHCQSSNKKILPAAYSVPTICKCGCGELLYNPDSHYRFRAFIHGHANKNGNHPRLGYKESEEHVCMRMKKALAGQRARVSTSIEKELYAYLDILGIEYDRQYQIGRFRPDAYVDKYKLCIFADGIYWHSKPNVIERDNRANAYLSDLGYKVIRLLSDKNNKLIGLENLNEYSGAM